MSPGLIGEIEAARLHHTSAPTVAAVAPPAAADDGRLGPGSPLPTTARRPRPSLTDVLVAAARTVAARHGVPYTAPLESVVLHFGAGGHVSVGLIGDDRGAVVVYAGADSTVDWLAMAAAAADLQRQARAAMVYAAAHDDKGV